MFVQSPNCKFIGLMQNSTTHSLVRLGMVVKRLFLIRANSVGCSKTLVQLFVVVGEASPEQTSFKHTDLVHIDLQQTPFSSVLQLSFVNSKPSFSHSGVAGVMAASFDCCSLKAGHSSLLLQCRPASHPPVKCNIDDFV